MTLFSFILATATVVLAAPQWPERSSREILSDYPTWALREEQSAFVYFELFVDPKGNVQRCDIVASAGNERLAKQVCTMNRRTKMRPAVDINGEPTFGKRRDEIKLVLPGTELGEEVSNLKANAQYQLAVKSLPPEDGNRKQISLAMQIGRDGLVEACAEKNGDGSAYSEAACTFLQDDRFAIETGKEGTPVSYVNEVSVEFAVEQPSG